MRFWNTRYSRRPSAVIITGISGSSIRKVSPLWEMGPSRSARVCRRSLAKSSRSKWTGSWPEAALLTSNTSWTITASRRAFSSMIRA